MAYPFIAGKFDIELSAERSAIHIGFGALVDQAAFFARKGSTVVFALKEVLAQFRTDCFEHEAEMTDQRIVAQNRMTRLHDVAYAETAQHQRNRRPPPTGQVVCGQRCQRDCQKQYYP